MSHPSAEQQEQHENGQMKTDANDFRQGCPAAKTPLPPTPRPTDSCVGSPNQLRRKPGRPKAIPPSLVPKVVSLHKEECLGYRRIAKELEKYGLSPDWSTVRRVIKAAEGSPPTAGEANQASSDTNLTLGGLTGK